MVERTTDPMRRIDIHITVEQDERLREIARTTGQSKADLIRQAIEEVWMKDVK